MKPAGHNIDDGYECIDGYCIPELECGVVDDATGEEKGCNDDEVCVEGYCIPEEPGDDTCGVDFCTSEAQKCVDNVCENKTPKELCEEGCQWLDHEGFYCNENNECVSPPPPLGISVIGYTATLSPCPVTNESTGETFDCAHTLELWFSEDGQTTLFVDTFTSEGSVSFDLTEDERAFALRYLDTNDMLDYLRGDEGNNHQCSVCKEYNEQNQCVEFGQRTDEDNLFPGYREEAFAQTRLTIYEGSRRESLERPLEYCLDEQASYLRGVLKSLRSKYFPMSL